MQGTVSAEIVTAKHDIQCFVDTVASKEVLPRFRLRLPESKVVSLSW